MEETTKQQQPKVRMDLEQRRVLISASLVSILVLVSFTNQNLLNQYAKMHPVVQPQKRSMASATVHLDRAEYAWERNLAEKIANENLESRELASVGRKPSAFEELRFGTLEGKYAFQLEDGKIKTIDFVDSDISNDRPKYINDKVDFLNKNHELFIFNYNKVTKAEEIASGALVAEVYHLYDEKQKLVGQVRFISDLEGRARSIRAEPAN